MSDTEPANQNAPLSPPLTIDVISDVMCPWCYIGKRRLETALAETALTESASKPEIRWRPFQLDHTIPPEGMDRQDYLNRKFGGPEKAETAYEPVHAAGKAEGIAFALDKIKISPNTLNAHRLIRWAQPSGLQGDMVERLFRLYFIEGGNLSDTAVLLEAAAEVGLERPVIERLLSGDADLEETRAEIAEAQHIGITGVPTYIFAGKYVVVGAQSPQVLASAITKVSEEISAAPKS